MKTSVALCTYNGEKYLSQQLDSIFRQSHAVDEIIVCDDGSQDGTLSILEAFQTQHPDTLKIYRNGQNLGGRKNFERCFELCTGDVIFFSDQDDIWQQDKVQKIVAAFEEDKACWCIATDACMIGENGEDLHRSFWQSFGFSTSDLEKGGIGGLCEFVLRHHNVIAGAMLAVRKEAKPHIYPFRFPSGMWHDEWITIILSCLGKMKLVEEKLVSYRLHSGQQMGAGNGSMDLASWAEKIKGEERLRKDPEFFLSHAWYTYNKLHQLKKEQPLLALSELEKSLHQRLQDAKKTFLKSQAYIKRKGRLLKWRMEARYITTWKDVITM